MPDAAAIENLTANLAAKRDRLLAQLHDMQSCAVAFSGGIDSTVVAKAAQEKGVGEASAEHLKGARLVRAFNSFGAGTFTKEAHRQGELLGVPIASDDAEAWKVAARLVRDAGFEPVAVPLARAKEFAPPGPLFTKALPVSELRKALGITQ